MTYRMPGMVTALEKPKKRYYAENPIDMKALFEKDKAIMESARLKKEHIAAMEKWEVDRDREEQTHNMFANSYLNGLKVGVIESTSRAIADRVLSETFANIYIKCLPLDKEFVTENTEHLKDFGFMYIRKLGGMDYLKRRVKEAHSPFISKLYSVCMEQAKKMANKRAKKVMAQTSSDLLHEITDKPINDEENREILKNINTLGADELAELVKQKIINVVKDEKNREKEEREFRTVIKNELLDTSTTSPVTGLQNNKNKSGLPDTGDQLEDVDTTDDSTIPDTGKPDKATTKKPGKSGFNPESLQKSNSKDAMEKEEKKAVKKSKDIEQDADVDDMDDEVKDVKKDKKGKDLLKETWVPNLTLQEIQESYNPVNSSFNYTDTLKRKDLLFSMTNAILNQNVKNVAVRENSQLNNSKNKVVMENPLNLDVFSTYLQNGDDTINTLETAPISDPNVIGSSEHVIDHAALLTEAVIQYGLLETAYTMKLIDVTPAMVKEQCDYLNDM